MNCNDFKLLLKNLIQFLNYALLTVKFYFVILNNLFFCNKIELFYTFDFTPRFLVYFLIKKKKKKEAIMFFFE